jgi:hypothetical protein
MTIKIKREDQIRIWGVLDLSYAAWYFAWRIFHGQTPVLHDVMQSIQTSRSFGEARPIYTTSISSFFLVSTFASGILLLKRHQSAPLLTYIQTPFRLLFLVPSVFFILWPLSSIFDSPPTLIGVMLVVCSEALKLYSVVSWAKGGRVFHLASS